MNYEELREMVAEIVNSKTMPSFDVKHDGYYRNLDVYLKDQGGYNEVFVSIEIPLNQVAGFMTCQAVEEILERINKENDK